MSSVSQLQLTDGFNCFPRFSLRVWPLVCLEAPVKVGCCVLLCELLVLYVGVRVRGEKRLSENRSWGGIELPNALGGHGNLIFGFLCSDVN